MQKSQVKSYQTEIQIKFKNQEIKLQELSKANQLQKQELNNVKKYFSQRMDEIQNSYKKRQHEQVNDIAFEKKQISQLRQMIIQQKKEIELLKVMIIEQRYKNNKQSSNDLIEQKKQLTYFDSNHPHFSKFKITNNNKITFTNPFDYHGYHILSPIKIGEKFSTFSYKVIKTSNDNILYGIGSSELKNNQKNQHINNDFIGYYGYNNGYVYDQKNRKGLHTHTGKITKNDTIRVEVNLKAREVTWFKNGSTKLYTSQISQRLAEKDLYPVLMMSDTEDTVQMSYD